MKAAIHVVSEGVEFFNAPSQVELSCEDMTLLELDAVLKLGLLGVERGSAFNATVISAEMPPPAAHAATDEPPAMSLPAAAGTGRAADDTYRHMT
ncbi:MAG: hypothetical protein ACPGWS_00535 [Solirubrobacterales bacterium]